MLGFIEHLLIIKQLPSLSLVMHDSKQETANPMLASFSFIGSRKEAIALYRREEHLATFYRLLSRGKAVCETKGCGAED